MFVFLKCVAEAVAEKGLRGLAQMIPGGGAVFEIATAAWERYRLRCGEAQQRREIEQLAQASFEEAKQAAVAAAKQVAGGNSDVEAVVEVFLTQIPASIRQSLKRADDLEGKSVPGNFSLRGPDDVARLLPATLPRFKAGDPLPGRPSFVLDRHLSGGGFGEVWLARQAPFGMLRAVKFCKGLENRDRDLLHEGNVIGRLMSAGKHPNVVPLMDAHLEGDSPWLMYEYVEGGDLGDAIRHWATLGPDQRLERLVKAWQMLASAVGRFHRLTPPIVHRDLKPANILYDKIDRLLRITDFGIGGIAARDLLDADKTGRLTSAGRLQSYLYGSYTPLYASSQQKAGAPPDPRDDVHALGVLGYQMFTGQIAQGVGSDYAHDLRELGVPETLIDLIGRCTAQKQERRPQDAGEIAKALAASQVALAAAPSRGAPAERRPQDTREMAKTLAPSPAALSATRSHDAQAAPPKGLQARSTQRVVPDQYATIQAALDAARPGDTVLVQPGDYRETLHLPEGVTLRGADRDKCRILPVDGAEYALTAEGISAGVVENLTFNGEMKRVAEKEVLGVVIQDGTILFAECAVVAWSGGGVWVKGRKSSPTLRNSQLRDNNSVSIFFSRGAGGTADHNLCNSIIASDPQTAPTIRNNHCCEGISFMHGARGVAEGNVCENYGIGIAVSHANTAPMLRNNQCRRNKVAGILFMDAGGGTAEDNVCEENEESGIFVNSPQTAPTLRNNQCRRNKMSGICFGEGASGTAEGNVCEENAWDGISVVGEGTNPTLLRNKCNKNKGWGIDCWNDGAWSGSGNEATGNGAGGIKKAD